MANRIPIGTLVRVRTDIPKAEYTEGSTINGSMQKLFGCIGVVCGHDDNDAEVFFDGDHEETWVWRNEWLVNIDKEAKFAIDRDWLEEFRAKGIKQVPTATAIQRFNIGDIVRVRTQLSDWERYAHTAPCAGMIPSYRDERHGKLQGRIGRITRIYPDDFVGISFPGFGEANGWRIRVEWLESSKMTVTALADMESELACVTHALEQIVKKIKP